MADDVDPFGKTREAPGRRRHPEKPPEKPREKAAGAPRRTGIHGDGDVERRRLRRRSVQLRTGGVSDPDCRRARETADRQPRPRGAAPRGPRRLLVNTWAIFLKKLQNGYAEPAVRVTAGSRTIRREDSG